MFCLKRVGYFIIFSITAILLGSCIKNPESSNSNQNQILEYFPTKVGNNWTYEYIGERYGEIQDSDTVWVIPQIVPGETVFVRTDRVDHEGNYHFTNPLFFRMDSDRSRLYGSIEDRWFRVEGQRVYEISGGKKFLLYDFSMKLGDPPVKIPLPDGTYYTIELYSDTTTIETPAGKFENCWLFILTNPLRATQRLDYLAKNVGLVQTVASILNTQRPNAFAYWLTSAKVGGIKYL